MTPPDGGASLTAHRRLRLLSSLEVVVESVEIIHPDWIELRLFDVTTGERWIVEPFRMTQGSAGRRLLGPHRIVGEFAGRIAKRFPTVMIDALEDAIADHQERANWDYDTACEAELKDYHAQLADALVDRLSKIRTEMSGPRSDLEPY